MLSFREHLLARSRSRQDQGQSPVPGTPANLTRRISKGHCRRRTSAACLVNYHLSSSRNIHERHIEAIDGTKTRHTRRLVWSASPKPKRSEPKCWLRRIRDAVFSAYSEETRDFTEAPKTLESSAGRYHPVASLPPVVVDVVADPDCSLSMRSASVLCPSGAPLRFGILPAT